MYEENNRIEGNADAIPYEKLRFTDDFMFCKVLSENEDICRKLAQLFTGRKVRKISGLTPQLTAQMIQEGKGVRFDIWFDGDDAAYDFEMQTSVGKDLPKRTRYYQSQMDLRHLKKGQLYRKLPDSYIIFICTDDPFDRKRCQYTFKNVCVEDGRLALGDGAVKIFVNAKGIPDIETDELKPFLDYINGKEPSDPLTEEIEDAVQDARDDEEGRSVYMTLLERDAEKYDLGLRKGREAGIAEGKAEGIAETTERMLNTLAASLMSAGNLSKADAEKQARKMLKI